VIATSRHINLVGLLGASILSNLVPVFSKGLYSEGWSPAGLYFATLLVVCAVLASHQLIALIEEQKLGLNRHDIVWTTVAAITGGVLDPLLFFSGLALTTASNAIIFNSLFPFFVVVLAVVFLRERFSWKTAWGGTMITIGVLVSLTKDIGSLQVQPGSLLIVGASFFGALTTIIHKKFIVNRHLDSIILLRNIVSTVIIGIWIAITEPAAFNMLSAPQNVWLFTGLPLAGFVLPYFLYYRSLQLITAVDAGFVSAMSRVIAITLAAWILGETLSGAQLISIACVVAGIIVINVPLTHRAILPSRLPHIGPLQR
jgi:drug/metabolite transporter, DME family